MVAIIGGRGRNRAVPTLHRPHATQFISDDCAAGRSKMLAAHAACGVTGTALLLRDVQYGPSRRCRRCWDASLPLAEH